MKSPYLVSLEDITSATRVIVGRRRGFIGGRRNLVAHLDYLHHHAVRCVIHHQRQARDHDNRSTRLVHLIDQDRIGIDFREDRMNRSTIIESHRGWATQRNAFATVMEWNEIRIKKRIRTQYVSTTK